MWRARSPKHWASFKFRTLLRCLWEVACLSYLVCVWIGPPLDTHRDFLTWGACLGKSSSVAYHIQYLSVLTGVPDSDMEHISNCSMSSVTQVSALTVCTPGPCSCAGSMCASTEVKTIAHKGPIQGSSDLMASWEIPDLLCVLQLQT